MDLQEFKKNFTDKGNGSAAAVIDFIWKEKDVLFVDAVNIGVLNRLQRNKSGKPSISKKLIKYLNKMNAISIKNERITVNDDFVPLSQRQ